MKPNLAVLSPNLAFDVREFLISLANGETPPNRFQGLCGNLDLMFGREVRDDIMQHVDGWIHFSGDYLYPVPHPEGDEEYMAQELYDNVRYMWEIDEYGVNASYVILRRQMCLYLAGVVQTEYM